jgi:hypothetical protein
MSFKFIDQPRAIKFLYGIAACAFGIVATAWIGWAIGVSSVGPCLIQIIVLGIIGALCIAGFMDSIE